MLKYIDQETITNQTVLLRVDFNVPLTEQGTVADAARIKFALPTIKLLLDNKNRLILLSHLGKPKGVDPAFSLTPVIEMLKQYLPTSTITLLPDIDPLTPPLPFADNEIKFLENIRFFPEEKANDSAFAKKLSSLATVYVNDAFSVCHRKDASVVGIPPLLPSYGGLQLRKEITMLDRLTHDPNHPFVAILGGSKISTKLPLLQKLVTLCDKILIGGGMSNTFLKAQGIAVGKSLVEETELDHAKELLAAHGDKLVLPTDAIVSTPDVPDAKPQTKAVTALGSSEAIFDIGPESAKTFQEHIKSAQTVLWNGPVGFFEKDEYRGGTDAVIDAVVQNTAAFTVIGGGDTLRAIKDNPGKDSIDHISTGGGAMLSYIADGTLPGIEALKSSAA